MHTKHRNFYWYLLPLAIVLLFLAALGHYWLEERRGKLDEEDKAQAVLAGKKPASLPRSGEPEKARQPDGSLGVQPAKTAESPAGDRKPETASEQVSAEDRRLEEILGELQAEKSPDKAESDAEAEKRRRDCVNNLKQIGLYLCLWISKYGNEMFFPSADPEGAVRTMIGENADGLLTCKCPDGAKHSYVFVKLPRDGYDTLPPTTFVAHESQQDSTGHRKVLCLDGSVHAMPEAQFQEGLGKQEEALRAK